CAAWRRSATRPPRHCSSTTSARTPRAPAAPGCGRIITATCRRCSPRCANSTSRRTDPMRFETLAIHAGGEADAATGAVTPPIHLSTTFRHGPAAERVAGYEYQREGNPTNDRLREAVAAMEGGATALTFASGMAAASNLLESLPAGARVAI